MADSVSHLAKAHSLLTVRAFPYFDSVSVSVVDDSTSFQRIKMRYIADCNGMLQPVAPNPEPLGVDVGVARSLRNAGGALSSNVQFSHAQKSSPVRPPVTVPIPIGDTVFTDWRPPTAHATVPATAPAAGFQRPLAPPAPAAAPTAGPKQAATPVSAGDGNPTSPAGAPQKSNVPLTTSAVPAMPTEPLQSKSGMAWVQHIDRTKGKTTTKWKPKASEYYSISMAKKYTGYSKDELRMYDMAKAVAGGKGSKIKTPKATKNATTKVSTTKKVSMADSPNPPPATAGADTTFEPGNEFDFGAGSTFGDDDHRPDDPALAQLAHSYTEASPAAEYAPASHSSSVPTGPNTPAPKATSGALNVASSAAAGVPAKSTNDTVEPHGNSSGLDFLSAAATSTAADESSNAGTYDDWSMGGPPVPVPAPGGESWDAEGDSGGFDDFGEEPAAADTFNNDNVGEEMGGGSSSGFGMDGFDIGAGSDNTDSFAAEANADFGGGGGTNDFGDFSAAADTQINDAGTGDINTFGNDSHAGAQYGGGAEDTFGDTGFDDGFGGDGMDGFGDGGAAGASNAQILLQFYQKHNPKKAAGKSASDMQKVIDKKARENGGLVHLGLVYIKRMLFQKYSSEPPFVMSGSPAKPSSGGGGGGGGDDWSSSANDWGMGDTSMGASSATNSASTLESAFGSLGGDNFGSSGGGFF